MFSITTQPPLDNSEESLTMPLYELVFPQLRHVYCTTTTTTIAVTANAARVGVFLSPSQAALDVAMATLAQLGDTPSGLCVKNTFLQFAADPAKTDESSSSVVRS